MNSIAIAIPAVIAQFFPDPLIVRESPQGGMFISMEKWRFHDPISGETYEVPPMKVTDFCSSPDATESIISNLQDSNGVFLMHDWHFSSQVFGENGQKKADAVLKSGMTCMNKVVVAYQKQCRQHEKRIFGKARTKVKAPYPRWKRFVILWGLKIGGRKVYRECGKNLAKLEAELGRKATRQEIINSPITNS